MKKAPTVTPNVVSSIFGGNIVPKEAAKRNSNIRSRKNNDEKPITFILFKVRPNFCGEGNLKRSLFVIVSQSQ